MPDTFNTDEVRHVINIMRQVLWASDLRYIGLSFHSELPVLSFPNSYKRTLKKHKRGEYNQYGVPNRWKVLEFHNVVLQSVYDHKLDDETYRKHLLCTTAGPLFLSCDMWVASVLFLLGVINASDVQTAILECRRAGTREAFEEMLGFSHATDQIPRSKDGVCVFFDLDIKHEGNKDKWSEDRLTRSQHIGLCFNGDSEKVGFGIGPPTFSQNYFVPLHGKSNDWSPFLHNFPCDSNFRNTFISIKKLRLMQSE